MKSVISLFLTMFMSTLLCMGPQESACYQWFSENTDLKTQAFNQLVEKDRDDICNGMLYSEHPERITEIMKNLANQFCTLLESKNVKLKYDKDFLACALIHTKMAVQNQTITQPTDYRTAAIYVYSQLLNPEEKKTFLKDEYLKNPQANHDVVTKMGCLLAQELVKLKLIPDTDEAKQEAAQKYIAEKMETQQKTYQR